MTAITSGKLVPLAYATTAGNQLRASRGFTLVELLVVIGIIGVLAGIMMLSFGGATESARAANCLTNMKQLAQAANSYAMEAGHYPLAGSLESIDIDEVQGSTLYRPAHGWISWLDNKNQYQDSNGNEVSTSHEKIDDCPFYGTGSVEDDTYALTNGTVWVSAGRNSKLYTCPAHVRIRREAGRKAPLWSYVMNAYFKYDYSQGSKAVATGSNPGRLYGSLKRADRTLMFAELPVYDPDSRMMLEDQSGAEADCTLQYKASINGKQYNSSWNGKAESIGFVHKAGKKDYCAHVAFADGHTEKLVYSSAGIKKEELTAILCEGLDVAFGKNGYQFISDSDNMDANDD